MAETDGKPTVVPAALRSVSPPGVTRGQTVTLTLKGVNLSLATKCYFDDPAITGEVMPPPIPLLKRSEVRVRATVGAEARIGIHKLAVETPFGTTGTVTVAVGGWPEVTEATKAGAPTRLSLPATAVGTLAKAGETDRFRFEARAGEELVFQIVASAIRSKLNAVLVLSDDTGRVLAENNDHGDSVDALLAYRVPRDGDYTIAVRDYENASGDDVYYRLNAGAFPHVTSVSPLGLRRGSEARFTLRGYNLGSASTLAFSAPSPKPMASTWGETAPLPLSTTAGAPVNEVRVAVGEEPEVEEQEAAGGRTQRNDTGATAQRLAVPVTVNGAITAGTGGAPDADVYRFAARKGQRLILEVAARRLGSALDSYLEVLDARGKPIERAALRCVAQTSLVLNDRDANSTGFRIQSWVDFAIHDHVVAGRELLRVTKLPNGPDDDIGFYSVGGRRVGLLDTTPEHQSLGSTIYKVAIHPPGTRFAPNGMPVFRLYHQNDDGGPRYGKDSRIVFDPPADGEYLARLTDARGQGGPDFAYRLTLRAPRPDFRIALNPEHPSIPRGGSAPVDVSIERLDDFDGPVEVKLDGLPAGLSATPVVIAPGAFNATLTLAAAADAPSHGRIRLTGRAVIGGREVVRATAPQGDEHRIVLLPSPDVRVGTDRNQVAIRPGGQVEVTAEIERRNGFRGRIPIDVRNLPFGVRVLDIGLNGVLVNEQETRRRFVLIAEPWVKPQSRPIYAVARVESDPTAELASPPVMLTVMPAQDHPK